MAEQLSAVGVWVQTQVLTPAVRFGQTNFPSLRLSIAKWKVSHTELLENEALCCTSLPYNRRCPAGDIICKRNSIGHFRSRGS